jgi:hypothetical protein
MALRNVSLLSFGIIGILWYYVCLFVVGLKLLDGSNDATSFRDFMSVSITTISVSLATFVGMLLGLRGLAEDVKGDIAQLKSISSDQSAVPGMMKLQEAAKSAGGSALQWGAALLYVASLLLALYLWYRGGNTTDPAITNLAKSLLGLIGGALSVILNLPR